MLIQNFKVVVTMIGLTAVILAASAAPIPAQVKVSPCEAKDYYDAAVDAAEAAQRVLNERERDLPLDIESGLMSKGNPVADILKDTVSREMPPEQKVKIWIEVFKKHIHSIQRPPIPGTREDSPESREKVRKKVNEYNQTIKELEDWLQARKNRDEADETLKQATIDYPLKEKDDALKNAKAAFDKEQAHIQRVRKRLEGRPADDEYKREAIELLTRTQAAYERLLEYLSKYDCFDDVRAFMDDLKQRMKKIDANTEIVRNYDPTTSVSTSPSAPSGGTSAGGGVLGGIAGTWRDSEFGNAIEISAGTAVFREVSASGAGYGFKRGDAVLTGIRSTGGDTLEAMLAIRAPQDTCPALGPKLVKASIKFASGGNSLTLTAPSLGWEYSDNSPCKWTNQVVGTINRTYTRVK